MSSKIVDVSAVMQVIGCCYNDPHLLDLTDKYVITDQDFDNDFHKIVYGAIYKLHELGADEINLKNISDFLEDRPKANAVYKMQKGEEWLLKCSESATPMAFDYYYQRLKKFSLLRAYDNYGFDISDIYDPDNLEDIKKKQLQEDFLDNSTLEQIADKVESKVDEIRSIFVDDSFGEAYHAADGIEELIERFKDNPEVGAPLYGPLINTVTRGARLKKFYLRSAATGVGKTRSMIADACYIACNKMYHENFINGQYIDDEEERVLTAAKILKEAPLYVEELPDFSLKDVEDKIKKNIREHDVKYVFHDYVHTSLKILEEITRRSGGIRLREDNILFMLSTRLNDICNQYGIFIMSATQLNGDYKDAKVPDQNLLRGAKAIADKIDMGAILLGVTDEDLISLENILCSNLFERPTIKISIYKNRRGRYKGVYLWCKADLGTCRIQPMFCTGYDYEMINIDDIRITIEEPSAF